MSVNEQLTTNIFPLSTYDTKYAEFVNKVLKESADSFEKEKKCMHIAKFCNY